MMRIIFPLLLLAAPVWAGEPSSASGGLRVQMGAAPRLGQDTSRCFLKGELVPCVGHAYDRRTGDVAVVPGGSFWLDGGGRHYKKEIDGKWKPIPSSAAITGEGGGSVPMESQGPVIVDRDLLRSMIREAEQQGGTLKVTIGGEKEFCYQKMREAMRKMDTVIEKSGKSDGVGTELALTYRWIAEHWRPVMKECVQ